MRLTEEQVAAIRTTDAAWVTRNDSYGNTWRVVDLLDTLDAAEARAEAAEAKLDEQIEAAIALRHDLDTLRDLYGAAEARIAAALALTWNDVPYEGSGETWEAGAEDALAAVRAALVEPVEPQRCPVSGTHPTAPEPGTRERGRWYDGGYHWCECGAIVEWENRGDEIVFPQDEATVAEHVFGGRVGDRDPQPPTCATCGGRGEVSEQADDPFRFRLVACPSCAPTESD